MNEFFSEYNDDLYTIAESFFNEIAKSLFKKSYIINITDYVLNKEENTPYEFLFQNYPRSIRKLTERDRYFLERLYELSGINVEEDRKNAMFYNSRVVISDINTISFYQIYLYLNESEYQKVSNKNFLDFVSESFLDYYAKEIQFSKPKLSDIQTSKEHIFIDAGNRYFESISEKLLSKNPNSFFFKNLIDISTFKYETAETKGRMILIDKKSKSKPKSNVIFSDDISLENDSKMVRKAIQLTNETRFLRCDSRCITGLHYKYGKDYGNFNFVIFNGYNSFTLFKGLDIPILEVKDGIPYFVKEKDTWEEELENALNTVFPTTKDQLLKKVKEVQSYQEHGAVIIITDDAENEANRFSNLSIKIKTPDNTSKVRRTETFGDIDGAIIFDENAKCHALGVILDGAHLTYDNSVSKNRGARYNSSLRYFKEQKSLKKKVIVVIMSEDGYVNILWK